MQHTALPIDPPPPISPLHQAQHKLKASIGNFATGNPDVTNTPLLQAYNVAIEAALKHGGILGTMQRSAPIK